MVVIKNINADVHLIDYNMYMFMMKYNMKHNAVEQLLQAFICYAF